MPRRPLVKQPCQSDTDHCLSPNPPKLASVWEETNKYLAGILTRTSRNGDPAFWNLLSHQDRWGSCRGPSSPGGAQLPGPAGAAACSPPREKLLLSLLEITAPESAYFYLLSAEAPGKQAVGRHCFHILPLGSQGEKMWIPSLADFGYICLITAIQHSC